MPSALDRIDFGPPKAVGGFRSFGLALLIHAALIAALTWGVNWKRSDSSATFEAELWSSTIQEAAPKLVEPTPPAPTPVIATPVIAAPVIAAPVPVPAQPPPKAKPVPVAPEVTPPAPKVDIALSQEKKRKLAEQKKLQADAAANAKLEKDSKLQAESQAKLKLAEDAKKAEVKKADDLKKADVKKAGDLKKAEAKKLAATQQAANEQATTAAAEEQRKKNIARSMGLAGAAGSDTSKGTAQTTTGPSGPSSSYGGKVRARVKPNIVFTQDIAGNPSAEVEVRTALDGTIMSQRLVKSSGNKAWDDAVVKAIIRTETMPRDVDGRVPTLMILEFRPRD